MNLFPSFVVDKRRFYSRNSTHLFVLLPTNKGKRVRIVGSNYIQLLLIGLCLGVTLGIAFVPLFEIECYYPSPNFKTESDIVLNLNSNQHVLEVPILELHHSDESVNHFHNLNVKNINESKTKSNKNIKSTSYNKQVVRRPRFFSTELGLRKKLICGIILTDLTRIENVLAINKTLGPHMNQLLFFAVGQTWTKKLKALGLSGVVALTDSIDMVGNSSSLDRSQYHRVSLKVIRYFGNKLVDNFDYFFIGIDVFYINGKNLMDSVKKISISQNVIWGSGPGGIEQRSCNIESGFVLSRSLVKTLSSRIDRCLSSPSLNMGASISKCLDYALDNKEDHCSDSIQNQIYLSVSTENWKGMDKAISIGPVSDAKQIYQLHHFVSEMRLYKIGQVIGKQGGIIDQMAPLVPSGFDIQTWPKGIPPAYKASTRFDVLKWKFFNLDTIYPKNEQVTSESLDGIEELDLVSVVKFSTRYLIQSQNNSSLHLNENEIEGTNNTQNSSIISFRFHHGYRRLDQTRGMEYILNFFDSQGQNHRIECIRPLAKIELLPMPFVTENRRILIIVPITLDQIDEIEKFLLNYFDFPSSTNRKTNSVLVFAVIVKESILESNLVSNFKRLRQLIADHNYNQNNVYNSTIIESGIVKVVHIVVNMRQAKVSHYAIAIADTLASKVLQNPNSLVLFLGSFFATIKDEFLNRVRMNTILNHQIFSPVPFMEFDPRVTTGFKGREEDLEVHKRVGHFDKNSFDFISFCIHDYVTARKRLSSSSLRQIVSRQDGIPAITSIFIEGSQLHILRAPEPSLKIHFDRGIYRNCSETGNCFSKQWGSNTELAKLILSSKSKINVRDLLKE